MFGTTEDNGVPSPELTARLDQALHLYKMGRAPWVVVTGGRRPGDVYTEAGVSATYLEDHGVSTSHILQGAGSDTWQNVATVLGALKRHHITDGDHGDRSLSRVPRDGDRVGPGTRPVSFAGSQLADHQVRALALLSQETLEVGVGRIIGYHLLSEWTTTPIATHHASGG